MNDETAEAVFLRPEKGEWRRYVNCYQNFGKFAVIPVGDPAGFPLGSEYYRTLQNGGRQAAAVAGSSDAPWLS